MRQAELPFPDARATGNRFPLSLRGLLFGKVEIPQEAFIAALKMDS